MKVLQSTAANLELRNGHGDSTEPWPTERPRLPHKRMQAYVDEEEAEDLEIGQSQLR